MTVDKELVFEFLLLPHDQITDEHVDEVKKVIRIVLNKWWSNQYANYPELESQILTDILIRKENYNPKFDAYNYVFTISRNSAGNLLKKLGREVLTDEFWSDSDDTATEETEYKGYETPLLQKYAPFLSGEEDWDYLRLRQDEVAEMLLFLHKYKKKEIPSYLKGEDLAERLYFVLNKVLLGE